MLHTKGLTINTFGIQSLEKGNDLASNKELFRIIWVKDGSGDLYVDMRICVIGGNTIYCIRPGRAVRFESLEGSDGYVIAFSADFVVMADNDTDPVYHSSLFHPLFPFSVIKECADLKPEMQESVEKMTREFLNSYHGKEEVLKGLLKIFLIYLNRQQDVSRQQQVNFSQSGLASRFFNLLEKSFANRKMVSDYASALAVTPNYLNETVKKASGFSASYHIQQRIILEAKRKAAYVRKSMKEIAYDLGFDDISHFSKYFKKVSGVSFTDFKKGISHQFSIATSY